MNFLLFSDANCKVRVKSAGRLYVLQSWLLEDSPVVFSISAAKVDKMKKEAKVINF